MAGDERLSDVEYVGLCPFSEKRREIQINSTYARFTVPMQKKKGETVFDAEWDEVISFEVCEVHYCKDDKTWPLNEELPKGYEPIGTAGLIFLFLMPQGQSIFPIWATVPREDVVSLRELVEKRLGRPSLPGLAHHGTAAAVKYILDKCEVVNRLRAEWHDYTKRGRMAKPNPRFRERGPDYVYCKEGMAMDFYGAGEQLEQMSTFWPWRLIQRVFAHDEEFDVKYVWKEDAYTYSQQVLDDDQRHRFAEAAQKALELYSSSEDVQEYLLIRPWSFPSRLYRTWDHLEPFASKASRNGFPPIEEYTEE